jgi:diguanylate cyclase (GGDEF)-like protein
MRPGGSVIVGALAVVTVGLVVWQAVDVVSFLPTATRAFWIIAGLALLSDWQPLRVGEHGPQPAYVFVSVCFTFAILLVWGLAPAVCVQVLAALLGTIRLRLSFTEATLTIARLVLALTAANYVLELGKPTTFELGGRVGVRLLWLVIGAALAWFAANRLTLVLASRVYERSTRRALSGRTLGYELFATGGLLFLAPVLVAGPRGYLFTLLLVPVLALGQIARLLVKQTANLRSDSLTGALSVRGLTAEFSRLSRETGNQNATVGLSVVNVEQAGQVRELFGRDIGDAMLAMAARRVTAVTADYGVVGRISGDEFVVLTSGQDALVAAGRIREALMQTGYIDNLPFDLSGRIGVAIGPEFGTDLATLTRNADEAAGAARRTSRPVAVYEPREASESAQRIELLRDLNQALTQRNRHDEIGMVYQPQVAVGTGEFIALEALLRWTSPRLGTISPQRLIEVIEPTVLMHTLTARIIEDVAAQLAAWTASGLRVRTAINVSVRDLVQDSIADRVIAVLRRAGISHEQVELEITEGALVADEPRISHAVAQLADAGIAVSVDDFGTGYSSLLYLRSLAVAEVKIDRGLVQRITVDPDDRTIVRTIIEMGEALGLRVVAEGVEDEATNGVLAELRCPAAQGYYYSRPLSPTDVPSWLMAREARSHDVDKHLS